MENIILTGYMGSGKTTVGKLIAKIMGYTFIDTDEMIAVQEGRSISEIFATDGEQTFRDLETELLKRFIKDQRERLVISTGGGMPVREENRQILKQLGRVVYLKASPAVIHDRIKDDTERPLLQCADPLKRIEEMIAARGPLYEDGAEIVINVDGLTPSEAADEVGRIYKRDY